MDNHNGNVFLLPLLSQPAFCVKDGIITQLNSAAGEYLLRIGTEIAPLISVGVEDYQAFTDGCLCLTLLLGGKEIGARVHAGAAEHIFILDGAEDIPALQSLALAARELREPLAGIMAAADRLLPAALERDDPQASLQAAQMNHRLFQMLRTIGNMSDAVQYTRPDTARMETVNLTAFFSELFQSAAPLVEKAGISLHYTGLSRTVYGLADRERLERAVYNLLSNAMRACEQGGHIDVWIGAEENSVTISVADNGSGIATAQLSGIYTRYLRYPSPTDRDSGLGLGMVLVRSAAALHGGTVLIDRPATGGTRVSMRISLQPSTPAVVRSPALRVDYSGEREHGLLELSDVLPTELYHEKNIR